MQETFKMLRNTRNTSAIRKGVVGVALLWAALAACSANPLERTAAAATTMLPAAGAQNVPEDMQLHLTFDGPVALGKGNVTITDAAGNAVIETIDVTPVPAPARGGGGRGGRNGGPATAPAAGAAPAAAQAPPANRGPAMVAPSLTRGGPAGAAPAAPGTAPGGAAAAAGGAGRGGSGARRPRALAGLVPTRYYPVIVDGNDVTIVPAHPFEAGKSYSVTIDAGAFLLTGNETPAIGPGAWQFTVRKSAPIAGAARITVAADGTGDFATVQAALNYIPAGNNTPTTLFIKNGTYNEIISFTGKNFITFLGEDRKKTILAYANNANFNGQRGSFNASRCTDLVIANLTLHNTTRKGGSQAEAIILGGTPDAHAIITNVDMYSFQDTLQINGQAYISNCYIEGDVDFMWGTGPCYFENCECTSVNNKGYYTQIRNRDGHGYVYDHCIFNGKEGIVGNFLGRIDPSVYPKSQVVLLDCTLGSAVATGRVAAGNNSQDAPENCNIGNTTAVIPRASRWTTASVSPSPSASKCPMMPKPSTTTAIRNGHWEATGRPRSPRSSQNSRHRSATVPGG